MEEMVIVSYSASLYETSVAPVVLKEVWRLF